MTNPTMTNDTPTGNYAMPYGPPECVHNKPIADKGHDCALFDAAAVLRNLEAEAKRWHRVGEHHFGGEPCQALTVVHRSWWGWRREWEGDAVTEGDYRYGLRGCDGGASEPITRARALVMLAQALRREMAGARR